MTRARAARIWAREYRRASVAVCGREHRRCIERQIRGKRRRALWNIKRSGLDPEGIRRYARFMAGV